MPDEYQEQARLVKIVHSADWHFGAKNRNFKTREEARKVEQEKLQLLTDYIEQEKIDLLLLAGDIIEHEKLQDKDFIFLKNFLAKLGLPIFIAAGNHDPFYPDSFYAELNKLENVHIFSNKGNFFTLDAYNLAIWGRSFASSFCNDRAGLFYHEELAKLEADGKSNYTLLACLHGELVHDGLSSKYQALRRDEIKNSDFAYLALGHIHSQIRPEIIGRTLCNYSGSLIPRTYKEGLFSCFIRLDIDVCPDSHSNSLSMAKGENDLSSLDAKMMHFTEVSRLYKSMLDQATYLNSFLNLLPKEDEKLHLLYSLQYGKLNLRHYLLPNNLLIKGILLAEFWQEENLLGLLASLNKSNKYKFTLRLSKNLAAIQELREALMEEQAKLNHIDFLEEFSSDGSDEFWQLEGINKEILALIENDESTTQDEKNKIKYLIASAFLDKLDGEWLEKLQEDLGAFYEV